MGSYEIRVNLGAPDVLIKSLTHTHLKYPHPHVSDSFVCWGNLTHPVSTLLADMDLLPLLDVTLQFLHSYNPIDAFESIEHWDPDYEEEEEEEREENEYLEDDEHNEGEEDEDDGEPDD